MTLKEKFALILMEFWASDWEKKCEQVADEFAIGFAEFLINYNYHPMHKVWIRYDKMANEKFTTIELLEIYKKQKGL
jgi:hypothetical protein